MHDVVIAGGGLAGSLAAWRLASVRPDLRIRLLERGATLGGNHTWSFHDTDVSDAMRAWLQPLVAARWPAHVVHFSGGSRTLAGGYASISSERLHAVIAAALGGRVSFDAEIADVASDRVTLHSGEVCHASVVIDARGDLPVGLPLGWQTFLGQEFECDADHGVTIPTLMDATVDQTHGFRFMYVLPLDARTLLVEDTCYTDRPAVDVDAARLAIARYADSRHWPVHAVRREEIGALPLPLGGAGDAFWPDWQPRIGLRAGLFHPTTGYSLPDAAATADLLCTLDCADPVRVAAALRDFSHARWRARGFFRLLNRLLFRAARPDQRVRVLEQFYKHPADLIARFYAARLTRADRCRLLWGRPPVSLLRAVAHLRESSVM